MSFMPFERLQTLMTKGVGKSIFVSLHSFEDDILRVYMQAKLRSSSWWIRYFVQTGMEENRSVMKKFEQAAAKQSYKPGCQIFHLNS